MVLVWCVQLAAVFDGVHRSKVWVGVETAELAWHFSLQTKLRGDAILQSTLWPGIEGAE